MKSVITVLALFESGLSSGSTGHELKHSIVESTLSGDEFQSQRDVEEPGERGRGAPVRAGHCKQTEDALLESDAAGEERGRAAPALSAKGR